MITFELGTPTADPPTEGLVHVHWPVTLSTGQRCVVDLVVPDTADLDELRPHVEAQIRRELDAEGAPPVHTVLRCRVEP